MNPINRRLSEETRAALAAVQFRHGDTYFDALDGVLHRARNLANGLSHSADAHNAAACNMSAVGICDLAAVIVECMDSALLLTRGIHQELEADRKAGQQGGQQWPR